MDRPTPPHHQLDYANPASNAASPSWTVEAAWTWAGIGFFIPFAGLVGIICGILSLANRLHGPADRNRASKAIILGTATLLLNPFLVGFLYVPSLSLNRPQPFNRVKCSSNLRQIGLAIEMYRNENAGQFPPDFGALLLTQDVTSDVFNCPSSLDDRLPIPTTQPANELANLLKPGTGYCSYFYCYIPGWRDMTVTKEFVVAYEPLDHHDDDGMNALFSDGHVDWIPRQQVNAVIAELHSGRNPPPSMK